MATVPKSTVKPELTQRAKNLLAKAAQWQGSGVKVAPRARFPRHRCFICGGVGDNFYLLTKGDGSTALVGETCLSKCKQVSPKGSIDVNAPPRGYIEPKV